ncbi:hypothetical protein BKA70DRAFT_297983 [Coprinopsis sp. MPI-PUGE-AT-0042]|nr:hypothetical protein BKA70DRAFT_297983 [Coprinopsis sp. MPI-PUGE-AT-0042]
MCLLCVSRVFGSLQTSRSSSPLFVDESIADKLWPVSGCIERRPSISRHCRRSFGGPAPFPQGIPEALFPSGETVTAILPNHLLDDITGSGSLTCPSSIHPSQYRTLARRTGSSSLPSTLRSPDSSRTLQHNLHRTCIYPLVSSPIGRFSRVSTPRSRSPLQFLQTRNSSKEMSGQGYESGTLIRFYSLQDKVTPATSSAAEPSLPFPERKLDADAGERETA